MSCGITAGEKSDMFAYFLTMLRKRQETKSEFNKYLICIVS